MHGPPGHDQPALPVRRDGPSRVCGPVLPTDPGGREIPHPGPMILRRSGQSGNKPFRDGTHLGIGSGSTLAY